MVSLEKKNSNKKPLWRIQTSLILPGMYLLYFILMLPMILKVLYRQKILTEGDFLTICVLRRTLEVFVRDRQRENWAWPWLTMAFWRFHSFKVWAHLDSTAEGDFCGGASLRLCAWVLSCSSRVWLCDPVDGNPPGSSVHGILQASILVAISFSRGSSRPRDRPLAFCRVLLLLLFSS